MITDVTTGGGNRTALEQASYALGYNLSVEYVAAYEKTWMLEAFQRLNERVFAKEGKTLDWVFLEVRQGATAGYCGARKRPRPWPACRRVMPVAVGEALPRHSFCPEQVHAIGEPMHAELGHKAVTDLVPAEHVAILRKGMHDHDRDMAKFYDRLTELLQ